MDTGRPGPAASASEVAPAGHVRGRPRSADRTAAILDAAVAVMEEGGWEGFRVQDVADRAGAGLATIYRRWPTRADLVAAAIDHYPLIEVELLGDPRDDLYRVIAALTDRLSAHGGSMLSILGATRFHPAIDEAVRGRLCQTLRPALHELLSAAAGRPFPCDVVVDAVIGILFLRAGVLHEQMSGPAFAAEILQLVDALT